MVGFPTAEQAAAEGLRLHDGVFFDGDPANNIVPSRDPAKFNNAILAELAAVIRAGDLNPDWNDTNQLLPSLLKIINDSAISVEVATTEVAGIVELATVGEAQAGTDSTKAVTPADLDVTLKRLAKTYTASSLTQADVDVVLDGVFFTKGSLIGLPGESYVWVQQIFYSTVTATARRKEIAYSYTGDGVYTRVYTTAWSSWSEVGTKQTLKAEVRSSSGTWVVPAGVTSVLAILTGGGGSGGCSQGSLEQGGGGAGGTTIGILSVTPGASMVYTIGAGGARVSVASGASKNGVSGGQSRFGNLTANGGLGGRGKDSYYAPATPGGTASGGLLNLKGGPGGYAVNVQNGNGGASFWGGGGVGAFENGLSMTTQNDRDGGAAGAGGGGYGIDAGAGTESSGAGGNGVLMLLYLE